MYETLRMANAARRKEWDPEGKTPSWFSILELVGELGELCNVIKKIERERMGLVGSRASQEDLTDEFGDVGVCFDLLAQEYNLDQDAEARRKFNKTSEKYGLNTRVREVV